MSSTFLYPLRVTSPFKANVYSLYSFYPTGSPGSPRNVLVTKSSSELTLQWTEGNAGNTPTTGYVIEARPSGRCSGDVHSCPDTRIRLWPHSNISVTLKAMACGVSGLPSLHCPSRTEVGGVCGRRGSFLVPS